MSKLRRQTVIVVGLALVLVLALAGTAVAKVWTDQADYAPGSAVTIHGSEYIAGEPVNVTVTGPNNYTAGCKDLVVAETGTWECSIVLPIGAQAIGTYDYTATSPSKTESGSFTDGNFDTLTVTPSAQSVFAGDIATFSVVIANKGGGETQDACVGASGLPSDSNYGFWDGSTPLAGAFEVKGSKTVTLKVTTASTTSPQSYAFTVTAYHCDQHPRTDTVTGGATLTVLSHATVSKTADASWTRTYSWIMGKSATLDTLNLFRGDTGSVDYTVTLTKGTGVDAFKVAGAITIHNPNTVAVTINSLSDVISGSGAPAVTPDCGAGFSFPHSLAAGADLVCNYGADLSDHGGRTNTATANVAYPGISAAQSEVGTAAITFPADATLVNDTIHVKDDNVPATSTTPWAFSDSGTKTYSKSFTCDANQGANKNTVTVIETAQTASETVTVDCWALNVQKDASTSLTRTWKWAVDKWAWTTDEAVKVDQLTIPVGEKQSVNYSVKAGLASPDHVDAGWKVAGDIQVYNPAPIDAKLTNVSDAVSGDIAGTIGQCMVDNTPIATPSAGAPYTLAAGKTLVCPYSADLPDAGGRTNTATITLQNSPTANGTTGFSSNPVAVSFASPSVTENDTCVDVTDSYKSTLGQVCTNGTLPATFHYSRDIGAYDEPGNYSVENTAYAKRVGDGTVLAQASWTINVKVIVRSMVTSSSLCTFDFDSSADGSQFRLIFTPDPTAANTYKLNASNPGQFYYNAFDMSGDSRITLKIPYPFVTQGAVPIHVYQGTKFATVGGQTCITPGTEIAQAATSVVWDSSAKFGESQAVTVDLPAGTTGLIYVNIHLDYGLKATAGYGRGTNDAAVAGPITISNPETYTFTYADGTSDSQNVSSENTFKRDPGIGGSHIKSSTADPVRNTKVQIYDSSNKLLGTVSTDDDGWYMLQYKYTGKAATFTVKMPDYKMSQTATLKSNSFVIVNFQTP